MNKSDLTLAVKAALDGDWEASHKIAQNYYDNIANWIHAVLHKIEGDEGNSRYWYSRTAGQRYEEFADAREELKVILSKIV
jgi:hypothetical protein